MVNHHVTCLSSIFMALGFAVSHVGKRSITRGCPTIISGTYIGGIYHEDRPMGLEYRHKIWPYSV